MIKERFTCYPIAFVLVVAALLAPLSAQEKQEHLGTWRLLSTKYGTAPDFSKYDGTRIKLINATHFTWVEVSDSKKVLASAGGAYKLSGNSYTETIDFAGEGMEPYLGKEQKFTIRVEGDKLYQSGELSTGLKIEEIWERLK